jgi:hypothetical protein
MTVRRRDLLGAAALVGTAATIPASSEAALLAPELRDRLFASYYDQTRLWGHANRRFASQRRGEIYRAAPILEIHRAGRNRGEGVAWSVRCRPTGS